MVEDEIVFFRKLSGITTAMRSSIAELGFIFKSGNRIEQN